MVECVLFVTQADGVVEAVLHQERHFGTKAQRLVRQELKEAGLIAESEVVLNYPRCVKSQDGIEVV